MAGDEASVLTPRQNDLLVMMCKCLKSKPDVSLPPILKE
jgi:hypothetical protein